ncbi:unnamed protein product [Caenorhabditis angaria]|uniref:Uncharacterized protein n=1 Tax=Caenorhabditis angaria TaxID=860376 RepID=A0A9P1N6P5_9PELO|nr:unnamed protein product [Caenorhabditis angaria]
MDETPVATPRKNLRQDEATSSTATGEEAPVTFRAGEMLTEIFSELTDKWNDMENLKKGVRMANVMRDRQIDEKINAMRRLEIDEILEIVRVETMKFQNLEKENELLSRHNREMTNMLDLAENGVAKAQNVVFDKMETACKKVLDDFHERESDLMGKLNKSTMKNTKLEGELEEALRKIAKLEEKIDVISKKNEILLQNYESTQSTSEQLSKKCEHLGSENFELQENLTNLRQQLLESQNEAIERTKEVNHLQNAIIAEDSKNREKARKHEKEMIDQMNIYRDDIQKRMDEIVRAKDDKISRILKTNSDREAVLEARNREIMSEMLRYRKDAEKYEKHFEMIESQIKGKLKRNIAMNYREMLDMISEDPNRIPTPPSTSYDDPLLDLAREIENTNKENHKKRQSTQNELLCPPSPKRTIGIQASSSNQQPKKSEPLKKLLPVSRRF